MSELLRERLKLMLLERAVSFREVVLSSGRKSHYYIDARMVSLSGDGLALTAELLWDKVRDLEFEAVGGPTIGADPLVAGLCLLAYQRGRNLAGFLVRREPKAHGTGRQVEGPLTPGMRAVIVEDTVTTGETLLSAIAAAEAAGAKVIKVLAVVDRQEGGGGRLRQAGYDFEPLFTAEELGLITPTGGTNGGDQP
ncbi:MAG: orotate phosphoribosyltransferase [Chloroflexota bacterium]